MEDGERACAPRARAYSCDFQAQVVSERHADSHAVTAKPSDELSELKDCLRRQQAQLDTILQQLASARSAPPQTRGPSGPPRRPYRFQPDGRPICLRCDQPGHIARFCQATSTSSSGPSGRGQTVTPGGNVGTGVVNEQQGN